MKANKCYQIFMTIMIVATVLMLLASGIIAIQKSLKIKASFEYLPGIDIEIYVKSEDNPTEQLIFRNFEAGDKHIEFNETYCTLTATTLTLNSEFTKIYGNNFSLVIYNYLDTVVETAITTNATANFDGKVFSGDTIEVTPSSKLIFSNRNAEFVVSDSLFIQQETTLTIKFKDLGEGDMMVSGSEFNTLVKKINNSSATSDSSDETITSVEFNLWNDNYAEEFGDWDNQTVIAPDEIIAGNTSQIINATLDNDAAPIRMFVRDANSDGTIENICLLSQDAIYANEDCGNMFFNLALMQNISFNNFQTSNVTNMSNMFSCCSSLTTLDVSSFDTSRVTDMSSMFYDCKNLSALDVSNLDTSSVTDMSYMFSSSGLGTLVLDNFDTGEVTDMSYMFSAIKSLTTLDVSSFDTSKVTYMSHMFSSCIGLTELDVSSFDTSKVTTMSSMFKDCSSLTSLDLSNFDTSNVTDMGYMFYNCRGLTTLDVSNFDTSNVTNMYETFYYCDKLQDLDLSSFNTSKVKTMYAMFADCNSLITLDVSSFNTSKVANMEHMFYSLDKLTTIYVGSNWSTKSVKQSSEMFGNSTSLVGGSGTVYNASYIDKAYARVDGGTSSPGYLTLKS